MEKFSFDIKKTFINPEAIQNEIQNEIKTRKELGVYEHYDLSRVLHLTIKDIKNDIEYIDSHIEAIKHSWAVDINDFEIIIKQKGIFGSFEFLLKKIIWKLLKFYTYRLFSQQREYNLQLSNAARYMEKSCKDKIEAMEKEINELKQLKRIKTEINE